MIQRKLTALEKSELYSSLWASCNELRGQMDASQYRDYVLTLLFVKYVSDMYTVKANAKIVVPKGGGFADLVPLKNKKEIGDGINKVIAKLAEENDLKNVIDLANFNDEYKLGKGKEMQDRLTNLVSIFENPVFDFSGPRVDSYDPIVDVYEYFMDKFASDPDKLVGGEFFTPHEISELIAKLADLKPGERIYDPACGTGLLLTACSKQIEDPTKCAIYGQEANTSIWALAKMNMLLHDMESASIMCGDTLRAPLFTVREELLKFDVVVADPPFGLKNWGYEEWQNDKFGRNKIGVLSKASGDFAWILHAVTSMKQDTGRTVIVVPSGVLFRGGPDQALRQYIVSNDLLEAVISLGPNLLYYTRLPINILILRANKPSNKKGQVLFINASTFFETQVPRNNISEKAISQILLWYQDFRDVPGSVKIVSINHFAKSGWSWNVSHYVKPKPGKLLENAIVSIRLGLDDFEMRTEDRVISAIRNLYAGMLLLFKEKLIRLSPSESDEVLIKSEVAPFKDDGKIKFKGIGRKTVEVAQIRKRFENLDVKVDWKRVDAIQTKRNDIEHYYSVEKNDAIREVISSTFIIISDFVRNELNDDPRELIGARYWNIMLSTSELYENQRKSCLDRLSKISWQPLSTGRKVDEIRCSSCNSSLIAPVETISPRIEDQYFACTACGQSISYNDLITPLLNDQEVAETTSNE